MSSQSLTTLYSLEEHLVALMDTVDLVQPEQEPQFALEFQNLLRAAVSKRDAVGQFLSHLDSQIELADQEVERLRTRKASLQRVVDRIEGYVQQTIESLGMDQRGKYRKLEGNLCTFSLRACPESVVITDEAAVPNDYKTLTLKLPARVWEKIVDSLDLEEFEDLLPQAQVKETSIDKRAVKAAINAKMDVPGVDLAIGKHSLRRD